jgi:hypothetical protein
MCTGEMWSTTKENKWMNTKWLIKWIMKEMISRSALLKKKWGCAPIIWRGREHPSFWGLEHPLFRRLEHPLFKRARALIIRRTTKQRTSEWMQMNMKEIKFMKCSLEKMRARTHYFKGARAPIFLRALYTAVISQHLDLTLLYADWTCCVIKSLTHSHLIVLILFL